MSLSTRPLALISTVGLLSLTFAGCAVTRPPEPSGFLGNYDGLVIDPDDPSLRWWEEDDFDWKRYRGVILEPVVFSVHPGTGHAPVPAEDLRKLSVAFHKAVIRELGPRYRVTQTPASDVLRVRCAITDVVPVRPAVNALSNLAVMVNFDIGGAAIEVEFLDSETGERLAAGIDRKDGHYIDGLAGLTRYGQARRAFRNWAKELRVALETGS